MLQRFALSFQHRRRLADDRARTAPGVSARSCRSTCQGVDAPLAAVEINAREQLREQAEADQHDPTLQQDSAQDQQRSVRDEERVAGYELRQKHPRQCASAGDETEKPKRAEQM